jgi:hypothetical protein
VGLRPRRGHSLTDRAHCETPDRSDRSGTTMHALLHTTFWVGRRPKERCA